MQNKIKQIQLNLLAQTIDGWLIYDYQRSNPLAHSLLEIPPEKMVTRRFFYWIPQAGDPIKIVPLIEPFTLDHLPGLKWTFKGWQDLESLLKKITQNNVKIAMEYSPNNALPNVSYVDGGTIELIRKSGAQVVSSANLLQAYASIWTEEQFQSHLIAAQTLEDIVESAWIYIEDTLRSRVMINEYMVQQFMLKKMEESNCETAHEPTCAINAHSADPHYHPNQRDSFPIRQGDFILLDLWCKQKIPHAVYADITRVGVAAKEATSKQNKIFSIVKKARDQATEMVRVNYESYEILQGWQVDQVCRDVIEAAGYGEYFIHRTGHNIGEEVHGPGANIDNFETHDYRELLPGTCFSIEPGIYLPGEFGVRLEYDVYLDPNGKVHVTGGIQNELRCLNLIKGG